MAAGSLRCLARLLTHSSLLLLGLCLHGATACAGDGAVIFKKVGDTVEFSPCVSGKITLARWRYENQTFYRQNQNLIEIDTFKNRLQVKPGNFSLTVKHLTTRDSGDFVFAALKNGKQIHIKFTLKIREPLTQEPELHTEITWHPENQSCSVQLECRAAGDQNVSFRLTVGNQSHNSSTFMLLLKPSDGDMSVSCIISNSVSDKSTEKAVTCINGTQVVARPTNRSKSFITIMSVSIAGGLLLVVLVVVAVVVCHCKMKTSVASKDAEELTVYADITENIAYVQRRSGMAPCSLYDTIENINKPEVRDRHSLSALFFFFLIDFLLLLVCPDGVQQDPAGPHQVSLYWEVASGVSVSRKKINNRES